MNPKTQRSEFNREVKELRRVRSGLVKLSNHEMTEETIKIIDLHIGYVHAMTDARIDEIGPIDIPIPLSSLIKYKLCDPNFGRRSDWNSLADSPELRADRNKDRAEQQLRNTHRLWSSRKHQQAFGIDASIGDMMRECRSTQLRFSIVQNALDRERECFDFNAASPFKKLKPDVKFCDGLSFAQAMRRTAKRSKTISSGGSTTRAAAKNVAMRLYNLALHLDNRSIEIVFRRYGAESIKSFHDCHGSSPSRQAQALVACVAAADLSGPRPICDVEQAYRVLNMLWP